MRKVYILYAKLDLFLPKVKDLTINLVKWV